MEYLKIDGQHFYNMVVNASNRLEEQKEYVNALNIFPVPDGDTGTNMSMTFKAAVLEIENMDSTSVGEVSKKLSKGALMGARGNSGVILSQIFRGIAKGLEGKQTVSVSEFAYSFTEGAKSAYKAVMRPTEGTILTIIRAAGEAAEKSTANSILDLMSDICNHSEEMLNKTPEMLPVLKKAKVVDAGGMGLLIILKGMMEALENGIRPEINKEAHTTVSTATSAPSALHSDEITFGYCTEFFILADASNTNNFKNEVEKLGDSLIVVGSDDLIKVHIHTNDPGVVLSKALKLGELSKIKIDNMREQHRHLLNVSQDEEVATEDQKKEQKRYGFISIAMGEGIKNIFEDLGVDFVIEGGQTMNPSTQDILAAIEKLNAECIFILPNNKNIIMAATQAVELTNKNVIVIPTKTIPQGITAITAFNLEDSIEENKRALEDAIQNVTTGQVTYAVRDTEMDGKAIEEGNILGLIEGKISEVGQDAYAVSKSLLHNMVKPESELITIFYGKDCEPSKVESFVQELESAYPDLDVQCYEGKQPLYYFIMSVE